MAYVDSKNVVHVQYEPMFRLILQNPQVNKPQRHTAATQRAPPVFHGNTATGTTFVKLHCNVIWQRNAFGRFKSSQGRKVVKDSHLQY